jgi:tRNA nucleotidyltransferase/poly(A) polymerase
MKLSELLNLIAQIADEKGISTPAICGGTPRDKVLGKISELNDIDLTTGDQGIHYLAKEIAIKLKVQKSNYLVMPDGHARILIGGLKLDFSSNFNIPNIDEILKKKNIINADSMQKELYSRDFTCNTLLMSLDMKHIYDPTELAIDDIKKKIIKTCLSPEITLGYDHKRIVRVMYMAAKLNFNIAPEIIDWVRKNPNTFSNVPQDYLVKKLNKAVAYDKEAVIKLLTEMNLWPYVPPIKELQPALLKNLTEK